MDLHLLFAVAVWSEVRKFLHDTVWLVSVLVSATDLSSTDHILLLLNSISHRALKASKSRCGGDGHLVQDLCGLHVI